MKEELIGLDIIEEVVIKCGDCGARLIEVVLTETNEHRQKRGQKPQKTKFKVYCNQCKGSSFETKVFEGSTIVGTCKENCDIQVVDTEIVEYVNKENFVIFNTLKVI